jgi:hypothetical protein
MFHVKRSCLRAPVFHVKHDGASPESMVGKEALCP